MIRVLFVDDDPLILAGYRRLMRSYCADWELHFAPCGKAALELLQSQPCDVVVSDMQMPDLDGAQLLTIVRDHYPRTARIVLSAQSAQECALRTIGPAHQFLSKPCHPETLKYVVERALRLHGHLEQTHLADVVNRMLRLPCLPDVYCELVAAAASPNSSLEQIGQIIGQDVAISAKLLQMVNSSFFGLCRPVSSLPHAASLLGINTLKTLVLTTGVFLQYENVIIPGLSLRQIVAHSLQVGRLAESLLQEMRCDTAMVCDGLTAGMMHDVGKMILGTEAHEVYQPVLVAHQEQDRPLWQVELEMLGASHAEVGAKLLALWGLPDEIVEAVAMHHTPSKTASDRFDALAAVHVANALLCGQIPKWMPQSESWLDEEYIDRLDLHDRLEQWRERAGQRVTKGEDQANAATR